MVVVVLGGGGGVNIRVFYVVRWFKEFWQV